MKKLKWAFTGTWVLAVMMITLFAGSVNDVESEDLRSWLPANAESTRALDLAEAQFPSNDPEDLLLIYARDSGLTEADKAAVTADAAALGVRIPPQPSDDGKAMLLIMPFEPAKSTLEAVRSVVADAQPSGLTARLTGAPAAEADFDQAFDSLDTTLLVVTVGVVAVLLLVTYRSPVLLFIPLLCAGIASLTAGGLVYWAAKNFGLVVDPQSAGILTVLVFGAATDYAMLLIARYREELHLHADRHRAMGLALRRSLPAIAASAATVVLALLTLLFADLNSTRGLGPVAAIGIVSALAVMTTLLPALLVVCGRWAFWPVIPRYTPDVQPESAPAGFWNRLAGFVSRHPRAIWMSTAAALLAVAFGATSLTAGLRQADSFTTKPESVAGFELLAKHYPAGSAEPVDVFVPATSGQAAAAKLSAVAGVHHVEETEVRGQWARIPVVLSVDPDGTEAEQTVAHLRETVHSLDAQGLVGGSIAQRLDQSTTMDRDLRIVLPLILLVVLIVLIVLLRSLIAPVLLLASVVLSFGAALGLSAGVYHLMGFPAIDKTVLLNGFLFLVALGVDYTIFLMTRAREEIASVGHREGITKALGVTGGVITSAGIVLAATFSVLAVLPIVFMVQLGVLVAVGVLLDTFVVRSLLVPALLLHVGPRSWWPSKLAS
ncbi:MMPL family transporter [Catelliglobosispora koreensis]|uniref:MMPL family transporter n=1 Tax=Catelliglobosispora koreensis TaxID=129052 RepID=UPI00036A0468|nr:MMPL family transporter [Catelliglobosispora koreensis]